MENRVIYDWVSITSKIHSPQSFIELMGLDHPGINWESVKGAHGYRDRLYWEKISIHYNGREDMGVWLEMSGQGCRAFESFGSGDYERLFREVLDNPDEMNLTRLDVAFDDQKDLLDIGQVAEDTINREFISRWTKGKVERSLDFDRQKDEDAFTINFGSMSSDIFLRIYDKAKERGFYDGRHWIRVELQLRDERALAMVNRSEPIGQAFAGVLENYLRFIDEPDGYDSNRRRWPTKPYWQRLLNGIAPIQLYEKPGTEYNMMNLENFVFKQAGGAIFTYLEMHTIEQFLEELRHRGIALNPKYKALIEEDRQRKNRSGGMKDGEQDKQDIPAE